MEIPGKSGPRPAGNWVQRFGRVFKEHNSFYLSYRFRPDGRWVDNHWTQTSNPPGTSPKISIIHNFSASCAATEITTVNAGARDYPIGYVECGARGLYTNNGMPPYLLQQGDYQCWWGDPHETGKCWYFHADEWVTFYYKITIGTWGKSDSTIEAWIARAGHKMEKWIDLPRFVLNTDSAGFDTITLTQYMTNKDPKIDHPTAYVWYDDLIISSQPIPPPTGPLPVSRVR